ncbi:hypothetical protein RvY_00089 [Ramazzottius varieornatus]|uniref:Uncharacterized protein n=1 Tax=Ramazzottius varieornatus TaxID=947166 RepID=A0A1D1UC11_RAMVA|nr:hypothetical protein RvY_00089 [Ramazzottius varieornatus]
MYDGRHFRNKSLCSAAEDVIQQVTYEAYAVRSTVLKVLIIARELSSFLYAAMKNEGRKCAGMLEEDILTVPSLASSSSSDCMWTYHKYYWIFVRAPMLR